jgi:hypothetical protein
MIKASQNGIVWQIIYIVVSKEIIINGIIYTIYILPYAPGELQMEPETEGCPYPCGLEDLGKGSLRDSRRGNVCGGHGGRRFSGMEGQEGVLYLLCGVKDGLGFKSTSGP